MILNSTLIYTLFYSVIHNIIIGNEGSIIMNIGERLRFLRKSKNISIYKISKETGISQNHISGIELGKRQPTIDTLSRLAKPLGITLAELFNEDIEAVFLSENEKLLIENYRCLPDDKAIALLNLSNMLK